ncbi:GGDEF domain-containing protein [Tautonia plasticadhaerens]|uniref:diguanylate cyclase n=1 Tax=Tautonia plasticadhaerens TaxID=2527974 RepID=A0A518GYZ4_9BACT|nr:GGDEF domain-containing protein [Tautonia plasticadhaerens]QDV33809.1 putative diguanylate cyclase YdaM [Tautonia plasticadhaerens]
MDDLDSQGGPVHPIAGPIVSRFLAGSCGGVIARLDADGIVLEAGDRLASRMPDPGPVPLAELMTGPSARRWRSLIDRLRPGGRPRPIRLRIRGGGPTLRLIGLAHREPDGRLWLLAMPEVDADALGSARELARELSLLKRHLARSDRMGRLVEKARREARTDPLTGLANRRQGIRWLKQAAREGRLQPTRSCCCIVVDLDEFKAINDTFGHPEGDRVLRAAARTLGEQIRPVDRIFRFGGEEFVVLLPETGLDGGRAVADRLRVALSGRPLGPLDGSLTASFGVACLRAGESAASLFKRADLALVRAKNLGRDRVEVEP